VGLFGGLANLLVDVPALWNHDWSRGVPSYHDLLKLGIDISTLRSKDIHTTTVRVQNRRPFRTMLIPVLFLSTIFFICYFLTIIPKRPFILTKVIDFSMLFDIEPPPIKILKQSKKRLLSLHSLEATTKRIMAFINSK
jgi:hypothetical protein